MSNPQQFDDGYTQAKYDKENNSARDGFFFSMKPDGFTTGYIISEAESDCNRQAAPDMFGHACASLAVEYNFHHPELLLPHIPKELHRSFTESYEDALEYAREQAEEELED
ncbi:hypothetical protein [Marinobacterium sp. BA1]|uniref:hypothetical protein n=1 Tax=Marinobacterium sp. BA1 TaxID=3138931 RepID=UPI0032E7B620